MGCNVSIEIFCSHETGLQTYSRVFPLLQSLYLLAVYCSGVSCNRSMSSHKCLAWRSLHASKKDRKYRQKNEWKFSVFREIKSWLYCCCFCFSILLLVFCPFAPARTALLYFMFIFNFVLEIISDLGRRGY